MSELLAVSVTANLFLIFGYMKARGHCALMTQLINDIADGEVRVRKNANGGFEVHMVNQSNNVR